MKTIKEPNFEELAKVRAAMTGQPPGESNRSLSARLKPLFPNVSLRSLQDFISAMSVSDYLYKLFTERKLSYKAILELAMMKTDDATKDFLGKEILARGLTTGQLLQVKALLRKKCSVAEALAKAAGEIPMEPKPGDRPASAGTLNDDIMKLGTQWRIKVQMALDLLPATSLEGGSARMVIFKKAYELRHLVREQLAFIDNKVEQFLKEMEKHAAAEAIVASRRGMVVVDSGETYEHDPGDHGGQGDEAHDPAVGSAEQVVQDPAQDDRG